MQEVNTKIISFDAETMGLTSKVVVFGFYDGENYFIFDEVPSFIDALIEYSKLYKEVICIGHNAGKFDNKILLEYILKDKELKKHFKFDTIISGSIYFKLFNISFWDSFKLMPLGLKALGKTFGFEKLDYNQYINHDDKKLLETYFKNDLKITYDIVMKFYEIFGNVIKDLGIETEYKKKKTIAGISFGILLNTFVNKRKVCYYTKNYLKKEEEDLVRLSYKGGRTEVFERKAEDCYYYDVNSLYPSVMYNFAYPIGRKSIIDNSDMILALIKKGKLGIIKAKVLESKCENENDIYYLAHKDEKKRLLFCDMENIKGCWTSIEIKRAMEIGYKFEFEQAIFWESQEYLFKPYVDSLYKLKVKAEKENNQGLRYIIKLALNSAYGKFGQKRLMPKIITQKEAVQKNIEYNSLSELVKGFYKMEKVSYSNRNVNPVYASFITAYARDRLYSYMKMVDFDVVYCDTDSIITHTIMPESVISKDLGKMKEEDFIKIGYFVLPKVYGYINYKDERVVKAKGMMKDTKENRERGIEFINYTDIVEMVEDYKPKNFKQYRLLGFFEQFKRLAYKNSDTYINEVPLNKVLKSNENKRKIINKYYTKSIKLVGK